MIRTAFFIVFIIVFSNCSSPNFSELSCKEVENMFARLVAEVFLKSHCHDDADCQLLGSKGSCECLYKMQNVLRVSAYPKSSVELQSLHNRFFSEACSHQRACLYNRSVGPEGYQAICTNGYCMAQPKDEDTCK